MTNIVDLSLVRQGRDKLALAKMLGAKSIDEENMTHDCEYVLCAKPFETKRKDARFCSDLHRALSNQLRHKREPSQLATLLFRASQAENQFDGGSSNPDVKRARDAILREAYDAIARDLGIVQDEQDEPENDGSGDPLDADLVREKLDAYCRRTGTSQTEVAEKLGFTSGHVSNFEHRRTNGSPEFRRAIMDLMSQNHGG